jgi:hypothetical protein
MSLKKSQGEQDLLFAHYIEDLIMLPMRFIQRPKQEHTDRWVPIHIQIAEIDWWKRFSKKMKTAHCMLSWLKLLSITDSGGVLWSDLHVCSIHYSFIWYVL